MGWGKKCNHQLTSTWFLFGGILVHYLWVFLFNKESSQRNFRQLHWLPPFCLKEPKIVDQSRSRPFWVTRKYGFLVLILELQKAPIFSGGVLSGFVLWKTNTHLECQLLVVVYNVRHIPTWYRNPFPRRSLKKWAVLVNQQQKLGRDMSGDTVFRNPAWNHGRIWHIYHKLTISTGAGRFCQWASSNILPIFLPSTVGS